MERQLTYTRTAVALHWAAALLIISALVLGWYVAGLPFSPRRLQWVMWHKWLGVVVLAVSGLRLTWRLLYPPPPLGEAASRMPAWQHGLHRGTHAMLYGLFFAVPISGWAYSSAAGFPVVVFGLIDLPDLLPADRSLASMVRHAHMVLAYTLAAFTALHIAAALKHHLVDRDGLLRRMAWSRGVPPR